MQDQRPTFDPGQMAVHKETPAIPRSLTVSQLNTLIKRILGDQLPGTLHLLGEISNFTRAASGHLYMTLKDDRSEIRAVMWKSAASSLTFKPADGLEVIATGHVDVYEPRGQYQFCIRKLEPKGEGALEMAFRELCDRLEKEGLFDRKHKKTIPPYPQRIAIVTSPTGAAISDILKTLSRRFPCASVMLHPVRVQGEGAAREIADAVTRLNRQTRQLGHIDLIIVARGGGSLEDLWAFNEEVVARAIYASTIPVISGVGHEVDVTIADLVADLRAPTPTAAAELAVPVLDDVLQTLLAHGDRLRRIARHRIDLARSRLESAARSEWFRDPLTPVRRHEQRIDEIASRLRMSWSHHAANLRRRIHEIEIALAAIQPLAFLQRQLNRLSDARHRLRWAMQQRINKAQQQSVRTAHALMVASPQRRLRADRANLDQLTRTLGQSTAHRLQLTRQSLDALETRLQNTSHHRTLARGFTITRAKQDGRIITDPNQVTPGQKITTETKAGLLTSQVTKEDSGQ